MLSKLKSNLAVNLVNIRGWQTSRKIIVFESDDWGSIRTESIKSLQSLKDKGLDVDKSFYNTYDTLEQKNDLEGLFNVITKHKDKQGRHPVFTPNMVVANPDFEKIKESGYSEYFYKTFDTSYKEIYNEELLPVWHEAVNNRLIVPEFHAREHVNPVLWLKALREGDKNTLIAFNHNFFSHKIDSAKFGTRTLLASYDYKTDEEVAQGGQIIKEGIKIFEDKLGYSASSFIACNYIWPVLLEKTLYQQGIKYIQTRRIQSVPGKNNSYGKRIHYTGQKNNLGQIYTVRNCYFEPSSDLYKDWVDSCLNEIKNAFFYRKPAIISSHRLNFVGGLDSSNRDNGLQKLDELLKKIVAIWPDAEFLSSKEVGDLISKK